MMLLSGLGGLYAGGGGPAEFTFQLPKGDRHPYAREVWAEIILPSQKMVRLPVYFAGGDRYAVRARASAAGAYRLDRVIEVIDGKPVTHEPQLVSGNPVVVTTPQTLPSVRRGAGRPARLAHPDGTTYVPVGTNLAWAAERGAAYYERVMPRYAGEGLNWMRVWMAHWSGLNLDWLPEDMGASPPPGILDQRVAAEWDRLVAAAEQHGVYLQLVLQHHGQYSSRVNPNWDENPWNAANPGGFLQTPDEFFTSPQARGLTALKYRYIVARWGYSPAVLAWELFNEVHWVDALRERNAVADVADWHSAMAGYLRSVDAYRHLITTSTEDLRSPVYEAMDFFQPHLYAANMLAGVREFSTPPGELDRPVFYGEIGDDHMRINAAQKAAGVSIVPPVWAGLMGQGRYAPQPWVGEQLIESGRLPELGAVARFVAASGLGKREGLTTFSPVIESRETVPFSLPGGQVWQHRSSPELTVPLDGRVPADWASIPRIYVGTPGSANSGFPSRATYHLEVPEAMILRARIAEVGAGGATLRLSVDGEPVLEKRWPAAGEEPAPEFPVELAFSLAAGRRTLEVENPEGPDWFDLLAIEFPHRVSALAAAGQRSEDFIALWVWHREGVYAVEAPSAVVGTVHLEEVPAGEWQVTWWDSLTGEPQPAVALTHPGGPLPLKTPAISRHAAVILSR